MVITKIKLLIPILSFISTLSAKDIEVTYNKNGDMVSITQSIQYHKFYKKLEWRVGIQELEYGTRNDDIVLTLFDAVGEKSISAISPGDKNMMKYILSAYQNNNDVRYSEIFRNLKSGDYLKVERPPKKLDRK